MIRNLTIGITGGIGAGKSIVSRILRCNGFSVYDCDYEAKVIMVADQKVKDLLIEKFGKDIYLSDGNLNKVKLAEEIFSNSELRKYVNVVVHKAVRDDIEKKRTEETGTFFIESAIIATGGIAPLCNKIWIVTASMEDRIKRVLKRDETNLEAIEKRIRSQEEEMLLLDKRKAVYLNNDNSSPLLLEVLKRINKLNNQQKYSISC